MFGCCFVLPVSLLPVMEDGLIKGISQVCHYCHLTIDYVHAQAFLSAWQALCGDDVAQGTPSLQIPEGKTFLLQPVKFQGPCKSVFVHVQVKTFQVTHACEIDLDHEPAIWI
jgi:hypothetical protein